MSLQRRCRRLGTLVDGHGDSRAEEVAGLEPGLDLRAKDIDRKTGHLEAAEKVGDDFPARFHGKGSGEGLVSKDVGQDDVVQLHVESLAHLFNRCPRGTGDGRGFLQKGRQPVRCRSGSGRSHIGHGGLIGLGSPHHVVRRCRALGNQRNVHCGPIAQGGNPDGLGEGSRACPAKI